MTFARVKEILDDKITFADFTTLALAFMACGALWWRVAAVEKALDTHVAETAPLIRDYKATQHDDEAQKHAIDGLQLTIKEVDTKVVGLQIDLAQVKGALGLSPIPTVVGINGNGGRNNGVGR